jgi:hypothetical protein
LASVKTNASMVAMSGAIMPDPLAMPAMATSAPPIRAVAVAPFGKVSVVMMALAASAQISGVLAGANFASSPSKCSTMRS